MTLRLQIQPTPITCRVANPDGEVRARLWQGVTVEGVQVVLPVCGVSVPASAPEEVLAQLERELMETQPYVLRPALAALIVAAAEAREAFEACRGDHQTIDADPQRHDLWAAAHDAERRAIAELRRSIAEWAAP